MDALTRRAVMAAARRDAAGLPVAIDDTAFWRSYGFPSMEARNDILARASALGSAGAQAGNLDWTGPLSSVFAGTGFPAGGDDGGPVDTENARVFARIGFSTPGGGIVYKSWADTFDWGTDLSIILQAIQDAIDIMEGMYGLADGQLIGESLLIY